MTKKPNKFLRKLIYWRPVRNTLHYSRLIVLPGFQGVPLFDVTAFFISGLTKGSLSQRAASLSFHFFLALFPLMLFFFTLIPYVPVDNIYEQIILLIDEFVPQTSQGAIEKTLEGIFKQKHQGLMSLGFLTSIYVASNGINAMMNSFSQTKHNIVKRHWLKQRLISIGFVFGIGLGVIISFLLIMGSKFIINYLASDTFMLWYLLKASKWILLISIVYFMFVMIYYYTPADKKNFKFFSAGATLATVLFILTTFGFNYYIEHFSRYNALYGSIGALIIFLIWVYLNSNILLIGFELNASIAHAITNGHKRKSYEEEGEDALYISRTASNHSSYRTWKKILKRIRNFAPKDK